MKKSSYKDLIVWQRSMTLAKDIYRLTDSFPKEEQFGIINQLRRAAVSVPSNIAEGHGRNSDVEFIRFLYISKGSLNEVETQLILSIDFGYTDYITCGHIMLMIDELGKMLRGLIDKLKK